MKKNGCYIVALTMICVGQNDGIKVGVMFFVNIVLNTMYSAWMQIFM